MKLPSGHFFSYALRFFCKSQPRAYRLLKYPAVFHLILIPGCSDSHYALIWQAFCIPPGTLVTEMPWR